MLSDEPEIFHVMEIEKSYENQTSQYHLGPNQIGKVITEDISIVSLVLYPKDTCNRCCLQKILVIDVALFVLMF